MYRPGPSYDETESFYLKCISVLPVPTFTETQSLSSEEVVSTKPTFCPFDEHFRFCQ